MDLIREHITFVGQYFPGLKIIIETELCGEQGRTYVLSALFRERNM